MKKRSRKEYLEEKIPYHFISPEGEEFKGSNLRKFCEEQQLMYWMMKRLATGHYERFNGWYVINAKSKYKRDQKTLVNTKTGERHSLKEKTRSAIQREIGLNNSYAYKLISGQVLKYGDWMLETTYKQKMKDNLSTALNI